LPPITDLGTGPGGLVRENLQRGVRVLLHYVRLGDIAPGLQLRAFREIVAGGGTIAVGAPLVVGAELSPGFWVLSGGGRLDLRIEAPEGVFTPYPDDALVLVGEIDQDEADDILGSG
jgi:hypothetical protein